MCFTKSQANLSITPQYPRTKTEFFTEVLVTNYERSINKAGELCLKKEGK